MKYVAGLQRAKFVTLAGDGVPELHGIGSAGADDLADLIDRRHPVRRRPGW